MSHNDGLPYERDWLMLVIPALIKEAPDYPLDPYIKHALNELRRVLHEARGYHYPPHSWRSMGLIHFTNKLPPLTYDWLMDCQKCIHHFYHEDADIIDVYERLIDEGKIAPLD